MSTRLIKRWLTGTLAALFVLGLMLPILHANAQTDAPPVLILPIDGASFLPGSMFDFRVEVHTDALPDDFAITVNGEAAGDFFGAEGTAESWELGDQENPTPVSSVIWRDLTAPAPGEYTLEVTAGGETHSVVWEVREPIAGDAKNVILFIADGANVPFFTAARLVSRGMDQGFYNDRMTYEKFDEIGLLSTSGIDSIITDSANSASAYNTGHKTATNATGSYPDTSPDSLDDPRVETFAELVKRTRDMAVGIVTTADWSDATPAAVFGHGRLRTSTNRSAYAAMPLDGGWLPEVILGGGARYMLPQSVEGSRRIDDRDMFTEYEEAGYSVVLSASELDAAVEDGAASLLGIFHVSDMGVWLDRNVYTENVSDFPDQPGLVDMTLAALSVLGNSENGFYLEIEAASTDKQLHPLDYDRAIADAIEFERAVAAAVEWAAKNAPDTLIVVTADHAHGFDVYGVVDVEAFNAADNDIDRRAAIGIYNNAGFPDYVDEDGDYFPDRWDVSRTLAMGVNNVPNMTEDFQVSEIPRVPAVTGEEGVAIDNPDDDPNGITISGNLPPDSTNDVHTLQDVPVYAHGPGSDYFGRSLENVEVFFGMAAAIGLDPTAEDGKVSAVIGQDADATVKATEGQNTETEIAGVGVDTNLVTLLLVALAFGAGFMMRSRRADER